ncbi:MAG: hypothetical protein IPQ02_08375 [Saprospiraceae bacterium]|nr:hypothetical protein [Candidatus Defluviibacterium haderslevense]
MLNNEELLIRIEKLEMEVEVHKLLIITLGELIKTMPQPKNLAELGRYLEIIKGKDK